MGEDHGEVPLVRAFWLYFVLGLFIVPMIVALIYIPIFIVIGAIAEDQSVRYPFMGVLALMILGYQIISVVGVWRMASC
jgi:hypothetical protein